MPLLAYRPNQLATLNLPIVSFRGERLRFEGEELLHAAFLTPAANQARIVAMLRQTRALSLAGFRGWASGRYGLDAYTGLIITRTLGGRENAWICHQRGGGECQIRPFEQLSVHRLAVAKVAGGDLEHVKIPVVRNEPMRVTTYLTIQALLRQETYGNARIQFAVPEGVRTLPWTDLASEYDLLTKMAETVS